MFRISKGMDGPAFDIDTEEQIEQMVRAARPGQYHVDEIRSSDDPFPSGHTLRASGSVSHQSNGRVALKPFF
jgi:hypothetical protein